MTLTDLLRKASPPSLLDPHVIANLETVSVDFGGEHRWTVTGDPRLDSTCQFTDGYENLVVTAEDDGYLVQHLYPPVYRVELYSTTDRELVTKWLLWKTGRWPRFNAGLNWARTVLAPDVLPEGVSITQVRPGRLRLAWPAGSAEAPLRSFTTLFELAFLCQPGTAAIVSALKQPSAAPFFGDPGDPAVPESAWRMSPREWDDFAPWLRRASVSPIGQVLSDPAIALLEAETPSWKRFRWDAPSNRAIVTDGMDRYTVLARNGQILVTHDGERSSDRVVFRSESQRAADVFLVLLCLRGGYYDLPLQPGVEVTEIDNGRLLRLEWPGGWAEQPNQPEPRWADERGRWLRRMAPYITMKLQEIRAQKAADGA